MTIISFKLTKLRAAMIVVAVCVVLTLIVLIIPDKEGLTAQAINVKNEKLKTNDDRVNYIEQFGWDINNEPVEVQELIVPNEVDETFKQYNELQKRQGYDLGKLKGKRVKRWTYQVVNYPGSPQGEVFINLIVYKEKVVAADVSNSSLDGFIHELNKFQ